MPRADGPQAHGELHGRHAGFPFEILRQLAALVTSLGRDTLQADVAEKNRPRSHLWRHGFDHDQHATDDLAVVKDLGLKVKKAVNKRYRLLELELDGIFKTMCVTQRRE